MCLYSKEQEEKVKYIAKKVVAYAIAIPVVFIVKPITAIGNWISDRIYISRSE